MTSKAPWLDDPKVDLEIPWAKDPIIDESALKEKPWNRDPLVQTEGKPSFASVMPQLASAAGRFLRPENLNAMPTMQEISPAIDPEILNVAEGLKSGAIQLPPEPMTEIVIPPKQQPKAPWLMRAIAGGEDEAQAIMKSNLFRNNPEVAAKYQADPTIKYMMDNPQDSFIPSIFNLKLGEDRIQEVNKLATMPREDRKKYFQAKGKVKTGEYLGKQKDLREYMLFSGVLKQVKSQEFKEALNRLQKNQYPQSEIYKGESPQKTQDQLIVRDKLLKLEEIQDRGIGLPAEIVDSIANMGKYAGEIYLMGGMMGGFEEGASQLAKVAVAAKMGVTNAGELMNLITERTTPQGYIGDKGEFVQTKEAQSLAMALPKSLLEQTLTYWTEQQGEVVAKGLNKLGGKILKKLPKGVASVIIKSRKLTAPFYELIKKGKLDGTIPEMMEEYIEQVLRPALKLDDQYRDPGSKYWDRVKQSIKPNGRDLIVQLATFGLLPVAGHVYGAVSGQNAAIEQQRQRLETLRQPQFTTSAAELAQPGAAARQTEIPLPAGRGTVPTQGVAPTIEAGGQLRQAQAKVAESLEAKRQQVEAGPAEGPIITQKYTQMEELLDAIDAEQDPGKRTAMLAKADKLDSDIQSLSNLQGKSVSALRRIAKKMGIKVPKGATATSIRRLLAGTADLNRIQKTDTGYRVELPVSETAAGKASKVRDFDTFAEAAYWLEENQPGTTDSVSTPKPVQPIAVPPLTTQIQQPKTPQEARTAPSAEETPAQPGLPGPAAQDGGAGVSEGIVSVPTEGIGVDPKAFQYKLEAIGKEGVTEKLKGVTQWNEQAAGTVLLWQDNSGKMWVVDGHHRVELAKRLGVKNMNAFIVREADGVTKADARVMGAISNLANERGTAVDAAKLFRDTDMSEGELAQKGVPVNSAVVQQGLDMKDLSDEVFRMVIDEKIPANMAAQIGKNLKDPTLQKQAADIIAEGGVDNVREAEILTQQIESAPRKTEEGEDLFGKTKTTRSLFAEKAKVLAHAEKLLKTDVKVFGTLSKKAGIIEKAGNVLVPKTNKEIQERAKEILYLLDKLAKAKGPVSEALNEAAERYADNPTRANLATIARDLLEKWEKDLTIESVGKVRKGVSEPEHKTIEEPSEGGQPAPATEGEGKKAAEKTPEEAVDADSILENIKAYKGGNHSPSKIKLYQQLGMALQPVRLQDAEELGRMYEMLSDNTVTLSEYTKFVEELRAAGKIKTPEPKAKKTAEAPLRLLTDKEYQAEIDRIGKLPDGPEKEARIKMLAAQQVLARDEQLRNDRSEAYRTIKQLLDKYGLSDVEVKLVDEVSIPPEEGKEERRGRATAMTKFTRGERQIVELALGADVETGGHEFMHIILPRLLARDRGILTEYYGEGISGEEEMAADFGKFNADHTAPNGRIRMIFARIRAMLRRLATALHLKGFRTVEDIFGDIRAGRAEIGPMVEMVPVSYQMGLFGQTVRAAPIRGKQADFGWNMEDHLAKPRVAGQVKPELVRAVDGVIQKTLKPGSNDIQVTVDQIAAELAGKKELFNKPGDAKAEVRAAYNEITKGRTLFEVRYEVKSRGEIFFSKLQRSVEERMPNKMSVEEFRNWSSKQGIRADEMKWTGADELLAKNKTVTKEQVLDTIAKNDVQLVEVIKGENVLRPMGLRDLHQINSDMGAIELKLRTAERKYKQIADAVPGNLTVEQRKRIGLEPSLEVLIRRATHPSVHPEKVSDDAINSLMDIFKGVEGVDLQEVRNLNDKWRDLREEQEQVRYEMEKAGGETRFEQYKLPGGENYREVLLRMPGINYTSPHWSEKGVLAHIRLTDRTGFDSPKSLVQPQSEEARANSLAADAKLLADIVESETFRTKGFGGLDVENQQSVRSSMLRAIGDTKIRRLVVSRIPIDVVNQLRGFKLSAKDFFNDEAMLSDSLSGNLDAKVRLSDSAMSALVRTMARLVTKESAAASKLVGLSVKRGTAPSTVGIRSSHKPYNILFIEEIQSDLHQTGREKGYKGLTKSEQDKKEALEAKPIEQWATEDYSWYNENVHDRMQYGVPQAPFAKTWHELAFKRVLRFAAEEGYDKVAWTTGEQQANRYPGEMRKVVDDIKWNTENEYQSENPLRTVTLSKNNKEQGALFVRPETGEVVGGRGNLPNNIMHKPLSEVIGGKMADQILKEKSGQIKGEDFVVGNKGMWIFYDQILPSFATRYVKKWGVPGVKDIQIEAKADPRDLSTPVAVHSIPVTAPMKQAVLAGQVKYELSSRLHDEIMAEVERIKARMGIKAPSQKQTTQQAIEQWHKDEIKKARGHSFDIQVVNRQKEGMESLSRDLGRHPWRLMNELATAEQRRLRDMIKGGMVSYMWGRDGTPFYANLEEKANPKLLTREEIDNLHLEGTIDDYGEPTEQATRPGPESGRTVHGPTGRTVAGGGRAGGEVAERDTGRPEEAGGGERIENRPIVQGKEDLPEISKGTADDIDKYLGGNFGVQPKGIEKKPAPIKPKQTGVAARMVEIEKPGEVQIRYEVKPERAAIDQNQKYGIGLALDSIGKGSNFILADGTGFGKTRQIIAVAHINQQKTGKPSLIVTQNKEIIKGNFEPQSETIGIDLSKIEIGTYSGLRTGKIGTKNYGVVIFDESHNLKNYESGRAEAARKVKTETKMYVTATPMDKFEGAAYFLAEISGVTREEMARQMGFKFQTYLDPATNKVRENIVLDGVTRWETVIDNIISLRDQAIKKGNYLRREVPFKGTVTSKNVRLPMDFKGRQDEIWSYWQFRISRARSQTAKINLGGQRTGELGRFTESVKVQPTFELVKRDLADGKKIIVVAEGINPTTIYGLHGEVVPGFIGSFTGLLDREGIKYAAIYGGGNKSAEIDKFQNDKVQIAVMTPQSGGAGIDLDDSMGNAPRLMYLASFPKFAGDMFEQVIGRVSRRNTRSNSEVYLLETDSISDRKRNEIATRKLHTLKAIQKGEDLDRAQGWQIKNENGPVRVLYEIKEPSDEEYKKFLGHIGDQLEKAVPVAPEIIEEQHLERSRRAAIAQSVRMKYTPGRNEGEALRARGAMAGPLTEYAQRYTSIRDKVDPEIIDAIFGKIKYDEDLRLFESWDVHDTFTKLIDGTAMTVREAGVISRYFGERMGKIALGRVPLGDKFWLILGELLNVPRTTLASGDMSGILRQARALGQVNPKEYAKMTKDYWKAFWSEKSADRLEAETEADPYFAEAERDAILELTKWGPFLTEAGEREERFMGAHILETTPGLKQTVGPIVRASERSFVTALNSFRMAIYSKIRQEQDRQLAIARNELAQKKYQKSWEYLSAKQRAALPRTGKEVSIAQRKQVAHRINDLTGRSHIRRSKAMRTLTTFANALLFSPRFTLSRIKPTVTLPLDAWRSIRDGKLRPELLLGTSSLASLVATNFLIMFVAKLIASAYGDPEDVQLETDLTSSDGGKIKIGNTRFDPWAGYLQPVQLMSRLFYGTRKTQAGKDIPVTTKQLLEDFGRSKMNPIPSLIIDAYTGRTFYGGRFGGPPKGKPAEIMTKVGLPSWAQGVTKEAWNRLVFLSVQDAADAWADAGVPMAVFSGAISFFGGGSQTYVPWASTALQLEQTKLAKEKYGKDWDELNETQQKILRNSPAIRQLEMRKVAERKEQGPPRIDWMLEEQDKVARKIQSQLPQNVQDKMAELGVAISAPSRRLGEWFLNEKRYDFYTQEYLRQLTRMFAPPRKPPINKKVFEYRMNMAKSAARTKLRSMVAKGEL